MGVLDEYLNRLKSEPANEKTYSSKPVEQSVSESAKGTWIPCQCCGKQYVGESWTWYVCDKCGYRICMDCYSKHTGPWIGSNVGGAKCSQCQTGWLRIQQGVRQTRDIVPSSTSNNQTPDGLILTNTELIARKYKQTKASDVQALFNQFMKQSLSADGKLWQLIDFGSSELSGAISKQDDWMEYAQFLSDYCSGIGMKHDARTPLFIIGGSDVIPMPEFYANIGHDVKTVEDSDLLYCFPTDYAWKRVSIKDAIFNVSRLPLDYVESGTIDSSLENDLGQYLKRAVENLKEGIPFEYAMMVANAGANGHNDWTWTSADVMAKLPQQELENGGTLSKENMFLCPSLDVMGEEYDSNDDVSYYKQMLANTDMLFVNLHGSHEMGTSGYLGAESYRPYFGMTIELMKQLKVPVLNVFSCYGARYGKFKFDNNFCSDVPDSMVYDREDSMLLTAFYESKALLFVGSCTSSMCSAVIGNGTEADHINSSSNPIDLLMPAGYAEAMLKLYACYLIQGEPAGYALLHAKIDYLNFRARYENKDLVFLTLNQFNLFGCPTLYLTPQNATHQLKNLIGSIQIPTKELPEGTYRVEYDKTAQGIDAVLNRARRLVDANLEAIDKKIREQLYGNLQLEEDNLSKIEYFEYNGQESYNLTYAKQNPLYPEFCVVLTDKEGEIKEVLQSR